MSVRPMLFESIKKWCSIRLGETHDALERDELPSNMRRVIIQQQYMGVQAAHDRVRDLRDRFQS
jgi:hypothetical protein